MRTLFVAISLGLLAMPVTEAKQQATAKPAAAKATAKSGTSGMSASGKKSGGKGDSSGSGQFPDMSGLAGMINGFINRAKGF